MTGARRGALNVPSCTRIALTAQRRRDNAISSALIALPLAENATHRSTPLPDDGNIIFSIFLGPVDITYLLYTSAVDITIRQSKLKRVPFSLFLPQTKFRENRGLYLLTIVYCTAPCIYKAMRETREILN